MGLGRGWWSNLKEDKDKRHKVKKIKVYSFNFHGVKNLLITGIQGDPMQVYQGEDMIRQLRPRYHTKSGNYNHSLYL